MTSTCQYKFTFSLQSSILIVVMSITLLALDRVRVSQIESNWVDWIIFLENSWVFPKKVETKSCPIKEYPNWDSNPQWLISESAPTLIFNLFPINILNSDSVCKMIVLKAWLQLFIHDEPYAAPSFLLKNKQRQAQICMRLHRTLALIKSQEYSVAVTKLIFRWRN